MFFLGILLTSMVAQADTAINLEGVDVTASFKVRTDMRSMPLASSSFYLKDIERQQIKSISDFAATTPNLHIPDMVRAQHRAFTSAEWAAGSTIRLWECMLTGCRF